MTFTGERGSPKLSPPKKINFQVLLAGPWIDGVLENSGFADAEGASGPDPQSLRQKDRTRTYLITVPHMMGREGVAVFVL